MQSNDLHPNLFQIKYLRIFCSMVPILQDKNANSLWWVVIFIASAPMHTSTTTKVQWLLGISETTCKTNHILQILSGKHCHKSFQTLWCVMNRR